MILFSYMSLAILFSRKTEGKCEEICLKKKLTANVIYINNLLILLLKLFFVQTLKSTL